LLNPIRSTKKPKRFRSQAAKVPKQVKALKQAKAPGLVKVLKQARAQEQVEALGQKYQIIQCQPTIMKVYDFEGKETFHCIFFNLNR
jgi:hypothetical protein